MTANKSTEKDILLETFRSGVQNKINYLQGKLKNKKNSAKQKKFLSRFLEAWNRDAKYVEQAIHFHQAHREILNKSKRKISVPGEMSYRAGDAAQIYENMLNLYLKHASHKYKLLAEVDKKIDGIKNELQENKEVIKLKNSEKVTNFLPKFVRPKSINEKNHELKRVKSELDALETLKEKIILVDINPRTLEQEHRGLVRLSEELQEIKKRWRPISLSSHSRHNAK